MSDVSVRRKVLRMGMHCADVSNPAKPFAVYEKWVERVMEEFYQQGDKERELGLSISPFMDRNHPQAAKCQIGFIKFIVRPLYDAWTKLLTNLQKTVSYHCPSTVWRFLPFYACAFLAVLESQNLTFSSDLAQPILIRSLSLSISLSYFVAP